MGHRALVAVETGADRYALFHSQWGGLALTDSARSPESVLATATSGTPLAADCSVGELLAALDPREYEALFVADRDDGIRAYLVVALGLTLAGDDHAGTLETDGAALVPVADASSARRLRRFVRTTKDLLGDAADAGVLPAESAIGAFRARLAAHPDLPSGTLWLSGEVVGQATPDGAADGA